MNDYEAYDAGATGAFTGLIIFYLLLIVYMVVVWWKIFQKAGHEGWKALIPFYNLYILTKIINKPGYWAVLYCIPYLNYIWLIWSYNLLSKKFGKDVGFTLGLVFLGPIFAGILAFGSAQYEGAEEIGEDAALDEVS